MTGLNGQPAKLHETPHSWRLAPAVVTTCIGVAISLGAFSLVRSWERQKLGADFDVAATNIASAIRSEVKLHRLAMESLRAFYMGSHNVERYEFRDFVQPFFARDRNLQALEWIPRVVDAQRLTHEATTSKSLSRDYKIRERDAEGRVVPAAQRDEYYPVHFVEPLEGNEPALGFDLGSEPTRLRGLRRARDTGELVSTGRITLVQEREQKYGFLAFLPVFSRNASIDTLADRRQSLRGFVLGVFRVGEFVEAALERLEPQGIDVHLSDPAAAESERFLYLHASRTRQGSNETEGIEREAPRAPVQAAHSIDVWGRRWTVSCTPSPQFLAAHDAMHPWALLASGLLITSLLTAHLLASAGRTQEVRRLVAARTRELREEIARRTHLEFSLRASQQQAQTQNRKLEQEVEERQQVEQRIRVNMAELERFNAMVVGREERMIELKHEVNELATRAGLAPPYATDAVEVSK